MLGPPGTFLFPVWAQALFTGAFSLLPQGWLEARTEPAWGEDPGVLAVLSMFLPH